MCSLLDFVLVLTSVPWQEVHFLYLPISFMAFSHVGQATTPETLSPSALYSSPRDTRSYGQRVEIGCISNSS